MHYEGFVIRIFPMISQLSLLWEHMGACRFIWNYMLDVQNKRYKDGEKRLYYSGMCRLITELKNDGEHSWLSDVSISSLQNACKDLDVAYQRFFEGILGMPKYKNRKRSKQSFPVSCDNKAFYFYDNKYIHIPKVGLVKYKTDREIPIGSKACKFSNVRVSYNDNKWFVSFSLERESQAPELNDKVVGIDLGVKELAVIAIDGEQVVYHNINKSKVMKDLEKKQKHIQRNISRKYRVNRENHCYTKSNNIFKEEEKLRDVYRRMKNIRKNYINQVTHEIISMHPKKVIMEDLNVQGLMKNKNMSKSIQEQCFHEFARQMKYKCEWNGIEFVQVDRYYPSSKKCSCCGHIKKDLKLSERTYKCPTCGLVIDRDFNAALNLSRYIA